MLARINGPWKNLCSLSGLGQPWTKKFVFFATIFGDRLTCFTDKSYMNLITFSISNKATVRFFLEWQIFHRGFFCSCLVRLKKEPLVTNIQKSSLEL